MIRLEHRHSPSVGRRGTYGPCVRTCIFTCLRIDAHMERVPCDDVSIYLALSTLWSARNGYQCCQCCVLIGRYPYLRACRGGRGVAHSLVSYYGTKARRSIVNMISLERELTIQFLLAITSYFSTSLSIAVSHLVSCWTTISNNRISSDPLCRRGNSPFGSLCYSLCRRFARGLRSNDCISNISQPIIPYSTKSECT